MLQRLGLYLQPVAGWLVVSGQKLGGWSQVSGDDVELKATNIPSQGLLLHFRWN